MAYANIVAGVVQLDPWLSPFKESLRKRYAKAQDWITAINKSEGGLEKFSRVGEAVPLHCQQCIDLLIGKREVWPQHRQGEQYHL
jgi:hypothetical protein